MIYLVSILLILGASALSVYAASPARHKRTEPDFSKTEKSVERELRQIKKRSQNIDTILENFTIEVKK